jgi:hypothetical protein
LHCAVLLYGGIKICLLGLPAVGDGSCVTSDHMKCDFLLLEAAA